MPELDYYSVMQKKIEYYARRYDPYNRLSVKNEPIIRKIEVKPKKIRQRIAAGYTHVISVLF